MKLIPAQHVKPFVRGLLSDYGAIFAKDHHAILNSPPLLIEEMASNLSFIIRELLHDSLQQLKNRNIQIKKIQGPSIKAYIKEYSI